MNSVQEMRKMLRERIEKLRESISEDRNVLYLCSCYFIATFLFSLIYPQFADAAVHIVRSRFIAENLAIPYAEITFSSEKAFIYPPIFHILGAFTKRLLGFYTVVPAFMGSLSIFLSCKLVEIWYDSRTAFLTAISLACIPMFFLWSSKMYVGTTITAGFLLVFYLYFRFLESEQRKYIYYSFIVGGILFAVKTYGPLASIIVAIHYLITQKNVFKTVRSLTLPGLTGVLFSLPWMARNFVKTGSPIPRVIGRPYWSSSMGRPLPGGMHIVVPTMTEFRRLLIQPFGLYPPTIVQDLSLFHHILPYVWFLLPLGLLFLALYGARAEKVNRFIWIWISALTIVYFVGRVASGGAFAIKWRHFITFMPMIALFMARSYQKLSAKFSWTKFGYAVIVLALLAQFFVVTAIRIDYANTAWDIEDEVENTIPEDDVIYTTAVRGQAYILEGHTLISPSAKPGFIHPDKDFAPEIREKADWMLVNNRESYRQQKDVERVEQMEKQGYVELVKTINNTEMRPYGEVGRNWYIYRVIK